MVFRIVTSSHPGDPSLEEFGCPRTEYLLTPEPQAWTCNRDKAYRFPTHRDSEEFAHAKRWHAVVAEATKLADLPERLQPAPCFDSAVPPVPVQRAKKRKSRAVVPPVNQVCRQSWVTKAYG